jgi:hypothetical protein
VIGDAEYVNPGAHRLADEFSGRAGTVGLVRVGMKID